MSSDPNQPEAGVAVAIDGASKSFANGTRALEPVTIAVREGEFVSIVGPSGCGKSTLLRMVAGLVAPTSGGIRVARAAREAGIGFVFQSPTLMPWACVEKNVRLPLELDGVPRAKAAAEASRALALVGLADFARAWPRELSGGMQMRVSIARALVTKPRLLLMDEPFGALDEITRNRLDGDLSALGAREGLTVLFVTHSIYEATFLSSRTLVMSSRPGRIVADLRIDEALPRTERFRGTEAFAATSLRLSTLLAEAMDGRAAARGKAA